jgi:hypothetical protein
MFFQTTYFEIVKPKTIIFVDSHFFFKKKKKIMITKKLCIRKDNYSCPKIRMRFSTISKKLHILKLREFRPFFASNSLENASY